MDDAAPATATILSTSVIGLNVLDSTPINAALFHQHEHPLVAASAATAATAPPAALLPASRPITAAAAALQSVGASSSRSSDDASIGTWSLIVHEKLTQKNDYLFLFHCVVENYYAKRRMQNNNAII